MDSQPGDFGRCPILPLKLSDSTVAGLVPCVDEHSPKIGEQRVVSIERFVGSMFDLIICENCFENLVREWDVCCASDLLAFLDTCGDMWLDLSISNV